MPDRRPDLPGVAVLRRFRRRVLDLVSTLPVPWDTNVVKQAGDYWSTNQDEKWRSNSHWREVDAYDERTWHGIGADHLALFRLLSGNAPERRWRRIVDWGAGGGANGVAFAPLCEEYVAVDLSDDTLVECRSQVEAVTDTPVRTVRIEVGNPEQAVRDLEGTCDLFVCFYVLELVPSPNYGVRLMRNALALLAPGGTAFVQVKYQTRQAWTLPRRSHYRRNLSNMTTYRIEDFWVAMTELGFIPVSVHLVPEDRLDERYAYFLLRKPGSV